MRYFIKAYPMHEQEVAVLSAEAASGGIVGDVHSGMVVVTADEAAIERLAKQGIVVQRLGEVPEPEAESAGVELESFEVEFGDSSGAKAFGAAAVAAGAKPGSRYWAVDLLTGVTDDVVNALDTAGCKIVERAPTGDFIIRTDNAAALRGMPFLGNVRPYGVAETLEAGAATAGVESETALAIVNESSAAERGAPEVAMAGAGPEAMAAAPDPGPDATLSTGRFEAICHEVGDRDTVGEAIAALGGTITALGWRSVRFILNRADVAAVAALPEVASVAAATMPTLRVDLARALIGIDRPAPAPGTAPGPVSFPFDGAGELIGVADTGIDTNHPDFAGKQVTAVAFGRAGDHSDPNGHGTHVAGTILGNGAMSRAAGAPATDPAPLRGVAPAADLYFQSLLDKNGKLGGIPNSLSDLFQPAYDAGVRVHNNSWGADVQARYDSMALDIEQFVHQHPDFLAVIAAGNDGISEADPALSPGVIGLASLGSPATAKNGLTVGASRSSRSGGGLSQLTWGQVWTRSFALPPVASETISGDPEEMAAFSSRGPVANFQIKPDVVAPGTDIAATRSSRAPLANFWGAYPSNRFYAFLGGTSMACPIVAGCAALTRQYYREQRGYLTPSAALLKATLINGTAPLSAVGANAPPDGNPNYHQGFGRIDLARTLPDPADPAFELFFIDTWQRDPLKRFTQREGRQRWEFNVLTACELRITIAWTDFPASGLQNQLRPLLDTRRDGEVHNWVGNEHASAFVNFKVHNPAKPPPLQPKILNRDPLNNVQVIRAQVQPGSHTLALFVDVMLFPPQDYALVATFPPGAITISEI